MSIRLINKDKPMNTLSTQDFELKIQAEKELASLARRDFVKKQNEAFELYREAIAIRNGEMFPHLGLQSRRMSFLSRIRLAKSALHFAKQYRSEYQDIVAYIGWLIENN